MSVIKDLRDELFDFVSSVDVSTVIEEWAMKENHPPKQVHYPGFWVEPVSNSTGTLDNVSNDSVFTFAVSIVASYEDAMDGEDQAIELADIVYTAVLKAARNAELNVEGAYDGTPTGQWGFDERYGQRVYRIDIAFKVTEPIIDIP
jgi:hypothetical protein